MADTMGGSETYKILIKFLREHEESNFRRLTEEMGTSWDDIQGADLLEKAGQFVLMCKDTLDSLVVCVKRTYPEENWKHLFPQIDDPIVVRICVASKLKPLQILSKYKHLFSGKDRTSEKFHLEMDPGKADLIILDRDAWPSDWAPFIFGRQPDFERLVLFTEIRPSASQDDSPDNQMESSQVIDLVRKSYEYELKQCCGIDDLMGILYREYYALQKKKKIEMEKSQIDRAARVAALVVEKSRRESEPIWEQ